MKNTLLIALLCAGWYCLSAQDTVWINQRYTLNYRSTVFTGMETTDTGTYITGVMYDTSFANPHYLLAGSFIAKFDTFGNFLWTKELIDTQRTYDIWKPTLYTTPQGNLASCGYSLHSIVDTLPAIMYGLLCVFDTNGDTLWTKRYSFASDAFFRPDDMVMTPTGGYMIASTYDKHNVGDSIDVLLLCTDSVGNFLWRRFYGMGAYMDSDPRLESLGDGSYLLSYAGNRSYYRKIDSLGNIQWTYLPPAASGIGSARDMIVTQDSGIVVGTTKFIGYTHGVANFSAYLFKYKQGQGVIWDQELNGEIPTLDIKINRLVELDNGNIVAAGVGGQLSTNSYTIWVTLLNEQGDSIWSKHYYPVGADTSMATLHQHIVYDMELTGSGELVLCGETISSSYAPAPTQQGWLLKIGLPTTWTAIQAIGQQVTARGHRLRVYPNPAQDYAMIDLSVAQDAAAYRLTVWDMQGRLLQQMPLVATTHNTFLLDVSAWAAGQYWLRLEHGGKVLETQALIKQ